MYSTMTYHHSLPKLFSLFSSMENSQLLNPSTPSFSSFSFLFLLVISTTLTITDDSLPCSSHIVQVKPSTPLVTFLELVQETALVTYGPTKFDPKIYVDMSLKVDLSTTEKAFKRIPRSRNGSVSVKDLEWFMEKYLDGAGNDLVYEDPVDFVPEPDGFLPMVDNLEVRAWAFEIHGLWKNLSRKVSGDVWKRPKFHTLLPLPEPVMIPGSRFREVYYWDSYWVIRGLLASKMYDTAKGIAINLISLIYEYGFVLNGARAYYTNKSQPPLLSSMIYDIYKRTGDMGLVNKSLPALLKEHDFWTSGIHEVTIKDAQASDQSLSRYYAMWNKPRPESATIDIESASKLNESEKPQFYRELASTAESGWDFSTRWMRNYSDLTTLATTSILPVDLNAFILKMEYDIAFLAKVIGEKSIAEQFLEAAQARRDAINSVFWNEQKGQWLDYWLSNSSTRKEEAETWEARRQNMNEFASNFVPIWIESFHSDESLVTKVMEGLRDSALVGVVGISTSNTNSSQQWDFPNGWAPLQHMIIEGLARSESIDAKEMAFDLATKWIITNYAAYKNTSTMHEKYDVTECGKPGGGGEYDPQTGFGWSNGVILALLEEFGWPQYLKLGC